MGNCINARIVNGSSSVRFISAIFDKSYNPIYLKNKKAIYPNSTKNK